MKSENKNQGNEIKENGKEGCLRNRQGGVKERREENHIQIRHNEYHQWWTKWSVFEIVKK